LVGVESDDCPTESRSRPEVASDDPVERDKQRRGRVVPRQRVTGSVDELSKVVEKTRLDEAFPVAADPPLDQLVPDLERQPIVLPGHDAVDDLEKMTAVDAGVSMSGQRVAVDTQLTIKHLFDNTCKTGIDKRILTNPLIYPISLSLVDC